jgi:hypothetical protein
MKKFISILLLVILCQSCNKSKDHKVVPIDDNTQVEVVKNFMKWYIKNYERLSAINTIAGGPMDANENETAKNYFVDFKEVENYLFELKRSGFLSDKVIEKERKAFVIGAKEFKEYPENDAPPIGFDYDHFFFTQETFQEDLANIDKAKYLVKVASNNIAEVVFYLPICGNKYKYSLKKINSKWLIDHIETNNN